MYKQKLQELCQQRKWSLPKYATTKHGFDHIPHFKSSVSVDGCSFDSISPTKSSKESQNDAAKIAFLHFTCSSTDYQDSSDSSSGVTQEIHQEPANAIQSNNDDSSKCQYKKQLESYALWKNGCAPFYQSITEGTSHAPEYRSTVVIEGHAFESEKSFTTLNEAENALAGFVLLSIADDHFEEDKPIFYKNLLQEVAQKERLSSPLYSTVKTGASHMPTFYAFVEMEGEKFFGNAAKSKKAAEASAAKVAYSHFEEKIRRAEFLPPNLETDEGDSSENFELNSVVNVDRNIQLELEESSDSFELNRVVDVDRNIENGYGFLGDEWVPFNE